MSCPVKVNWHHTGLIVSDMEKAVAWWEEMFGAKKMFENRVDTSIGKDTRLVFLKVGESYLELFEAHGLEGTAKERYGRDYGPSHLSLWLADEDFDTYMAYLEEKKVPIIRSLRHPPEVIGKPGGCKLAFIEDPDGNRIELMQSYTPGEYR